ncbi:MFS transporter [Klugiella xanthotipulae]|uniref:Putative proline/betaine transporter n=1 Tax=Klugiella xanthotipulae TaxID=244735 RepID=A0A543HYU9_9MICO|nr:MFS transporter [Klugiella xanthotipulae]TQM63516.1 putative MFS family arabinose efflux permease [Klugiella xanthotipulae]
MTTLDTRTGREQRRVAAATIVGTTVEWYDFFIYANAAALVFAPLFFEPLGAQAGIIVSFATVGVSFLFRPIGAIVAGHLGDRLGRRAMLVMTLLLMGLATVLIGVLPTYAQIGLAAPILLVLLRVIQGFSAGGEWGGAALMAVEHAPDGARGRYGAYPQLGVPLGMLLATAVLAVMTGTLTEEQFLGWGWRVPFLLSIVMIAVGFLVRYRVSESPVFQELTESKAQSRMPLVELLQKHWKVVLLAALTFAANSAVGYMVTGGYVLSYTTAELGMDRTTILLCVSASSVVWLLSTLYAGHLSDRIRSRTRVYLIGFVLTLIWVFPMFWLINTQSVLMILVALLVLSVGLGFTYGPIAAFFCETFPARVRYSGSSLAYALGAILGGAFAPMISTALVQRTGTTLSVSAYLAGVTAVGIVAILLMRDRFGSSLRQDGQDDRDREFRETGAIKTAAAEARRAARAVRS